MLLAPKTGVRRSAGVPPVAPKTFSPCGDSNRRSSGVNTVRRWAANSHARRKKLSDASVT